MGIIEILTLQLGPAIAKSVLKLWLKDQVIAQDAGASLIEILKVKLDDVAARQRAKRQFEEMGEKVAESLHPLFNEAEIDEDAKERVATAVSETINRVKITSDILVSKNLDPLRFARHLSQIKPVNLLFSDAEEEFYTRVLEQAAANIVDISSLLPAFTERTLGEILKRERQILDATDLILSELARIREESQKANVQDDYARFETNYRLGIARVLDKPDIFGLENLSRSSQRYSISIAYISLSVIRSGENRLNTIRDKEQVEYVLASSKRLLIRGQAGSGKTTLLKWIATNSAVNTFGQILEKWNGSIPFFIPLRKFVDHSLPGPEEFVKVILPELSGGTSTDWIWDSLASDRAVILIDGIDEVPKGKRGDVREWLHGLIDLFPEARYIVSSRPHAVEDGWVSELDFVEADLQPMDLPDITNFIDHWHLAIKAELDSADDRREVDDLAMNLKNVIATNRSILNLATNPLLCAALCALNRDRNQQLPTNQIDVYEAICRMLLERREKERNLVLEGIDYPQLTYGQKRVLLESLAYWMLLNGWSSVSNDLVERHFKQKIPSVIGLSSDITPADIRRLFVDRSGILREPSVHSMDFVHRSMQEYLAAKAMLDAEDTGVAGRNADDDQWQQVIILAAGLAGPRVRERLIREVLQRGKKEHQNRHKFYLLAVACLDSAVEVSSSFQREIEEHIKEILPPRSYAEAKSISKAGELAVPYLAYKKVNGYTEEQLATCIYALAQIGNASAYAALKGYLDAEGMRVASELIMAEQQFMGFPYYEEITSKLDAKELYGLHLGGLTSLKSLVTFRNLTYLRLSGCPHLVDLSPLRELQKIVHLHLERLPRVENLGPVSNMENLEILILQSLPKIGSVVPEVLPPKLQQLFLDDLPLTHLHLDSKLKVLSLSHCERFSSFDFLGTINVESLSLSDLFGLGDLSPLAKNSALQSLYLDNLGGEVDIEPLVWARNLYEIQVGPGVPRLKIPPEFRKQKKVVKRAAESKAKLDKEWDRNKHNH